MLINLTFINPFLFPIPYSLFPVPYSLLPTPYSLLPIPFTTNYRPE
ncbi:hypothetical protein [Moorena sp. SIO4G3]|nr:hypothetical protein [Moorena sp. SIO4G3]